MHLVWVKEQSEMQGIEVSIYITISHLLLYRLNIIT